MSEISIPDSLPSWIKEHIKLYLTDGEAGHLWDASLGGGEGMLTTIRLSKSSSAISGLNRNSGFWTSFA